MASADIRIDSAHSTTLQRHRAQATFNAAVPLVVISGLGVLVGLLYQTALPSLTALWNSEPAYPFGYLIPALSLLIAAATWRRRGAPLQYDVAKADLRGGLFVLLLGLAAHVAAIVVGNVQLDIASFILVVRGALRICGGRETLRAYEPAALLLLFMIPVSLDFISFISSLFARCTAFGSAALLDLADVPVFLEGATLHFRDAALIVLPATSGLRELQGVLAICLAVGLISGHGGRFCTILALLSLPIAVGVGIVRFTTAGLIHHWRDAATAETFLNSFHGATIVAVSAVLVLITALMLSGVASWFPARKKN